MNNKLIKKDDFHLDIFPQKIFYYLDKINRYIKNFEIIRNITNTFNSSISGFEERWNNTIDFADDVFETNFYIKNFLFNIINILNFIQFSFNNSAEMQYLTIILFLSSVLLFSFAFFLNFILARPINLVMKIFSWFNLIIPIISLIIFSIFILSIILLGTIAVSIGINIRDLKNITLTQNNTKLKYNVSRCFIKGGIRAINKNYFKELDKEKYLFDELDELYSSIFKMKVFDHTDLFNQLIFLKEMEDYLEYLENPNFSLIYIDKNKEPKWYIGDSNAEFDRLTSLDNSLPFQIYFNCSTKMNLKIIYNEEYCDVPLSKFNLYDHTENRYCYSFNHISKLDFESILNKYSIDGENCNSKIPELNFTYREILKIRFEQFKDFYTKFDEYKKEFFNGVLFE